MNQHASYTSIVVIAFLLILAPITLWLHYGQVDPKLVYAFVGIALFIFILGTWAKRKTGIVKVVRPYNRLGVGTFFFVLGVLLILGVLTLLLAGYEFVEPLVVGLPTEPISLPGLHKLLPVIGVLLMLFGLWINQSDKYYIRLGDEA